MGDLHAMAFLAKGDLQEFTDGLFVVDHKDVRHLSPRIFRSGFGCLHSASFNARKFDDELRALVLFARNCDAAVVGLNNLVDDGQPQASTALEGGLQRLKDLGALIRFQAYTGIAERDAQPIRDVLNAYRQSATVGHSADGVVAHIPEDLFDFVGINASFRIFAIEGTHELDVFHDVRFTLHEHEGFLEQSAHVQILVGVTFFARVVQKVRNDVIQAL